MIDSGVSLLLGYIICVAFLVIGYALCLMVSLWREGGGRK